MPHFLLVRAQMEGPLKVSELLFHFLRLLLPRARVLHNALGPHSMKVTTCVTSLSRLMYRGTEVGIFMSTPRQNFMCTPRRKGLEGAATSYSVRTVCHPVRTDQQHPARGGANSTTASLPCSADVSNFRFSLLYIPDRGPFYAMQSFTFPIMPNSPEVSSILYVPIKCQVSSRYPSYFCNWPQNVDKILLQNVDIFTIVTSSKVNRSRQWKVLVVQVQPLKQQYWLCKQVGGQWPRKKGGETNWNKLNLVLGQTGHETCWEMPNWLSYHGKSQTALL